MAMEDLPDLRDPSSLEDPITRNREEFTTVYDVIDSLETMLEQAKATMFSPNIVKIDRDEVLEKIEQLKTMLPVQLERASALMRESEHRLENAQSQANIIISAAQSRAADMVQEANEQARIAAGREHVTDLARKKSRDMLDKAQQKSDHLTQGADQYCTSVMESLRTQLDKLSRDIDGGLEVLKKRQREAAEQLPHLSDDDYPND